MEILLKLNYKQRNATRLCIFIFAIIFSILTAGNTKWFACNGIITYILLKNPTIVYAVVKTLKRDAIALQRFARLNIYVAILERRKWTLARVFQQTAQQHPNKNCLIMDDNVMTFAQVENYTNRIGAYFKAQNFKRGDCVSLIMETRPEYACLWLGLSKIGVITALTNSHLRREALVHSIKVANTKAIIIGTELIDAYKEISNHDDIKSIPIYQFIELSQRDNNNEIILSNAIDLTKELKEHKLNLNLFDDIDACQPRDKLLYVYTSGTTGLPKAAIITNLRFVFMTAAAHFMLAIQNDDIIYNPLPLYHTAGGIVGVGNALIHGCTVALRKKFSASNFWKDCIRYNCSVAQYIGELCRYLLSSPISAEDTKHKLRIMYGNGLRPQIWSQFMSRFNIPKIGEVYGSTEGNSNLANTTSQVGAIGFVPIVGRRLYPVQLIKCDEETGEPIRNSLGYCDRCKPGETGLLIGKIDAKHAVTTFNGYADKKASEKKLLHNVFQQDDKFFNSGDMIVSDILGYFYFKDRTGDTFRWRGENVATQEVEAIITNVIGLKDCAVYGVEIPHVEGKAGMATIVDPDRNVDLVRLSHGIRGTLPSYAQPLFIRLIDEIPSTATFKFKKRDLVLDGFDIHKIKEPIYYLNKDNIYRPLTEEQYDNIINGTAGL